MHQEDPFWEWLVVHWLPIVAAVAVWAAVIGGVIDMMGA